MNKNSVFVLVLLAIIIGIIPFFVSGCASDKQVIRFADGFLANIEGEIDIWESFTDTYNDTDFTDDNGIADFRAEVPNFIAKFDGYLKLYVSAYPDKTPQDLKDAVRDARDGTQGIIDGLKNIDIALATNSVDLWDSAEDELNAGGDLLYEAVTEYNNAVDYLNESGGNTNWGTGILLGTGILWLLSFVVVTPITNLLNGKLASGTKQEISMTSFSIDSSVLTFVIVDVVVLGIAGFLFGYLVGWYFIGIAWKPTHWPGMLVFIGLSILGSNLY